MATPPTRERGLGFSGGGGGLDTLERDAGGFPPSDRDKLAAFVRSLHELLVDMLQRPALFAPYNKQLRAAWVTIDPIFEAFAQTIGQTPENDTAFPSYGLTGAELDAKLAIYNDARDAYYEELSRLTGRLPWKLITIAPEVPLRPSPPTDQPAESTETLEPPPTVHDDPPGGVKHRLRRKLRVKGRTAMEVGDKIFKSVVAAVSVAHPPVAVAAAAAGDSADEIKGLMEAVITRVGGMLKKRKKSKKEGAKSEAQPPATGKERH